MRNSSLNSIIALALLSAATPASGTATQSTSRRKVNIEPEGKAPYDNYGEKKSKGEKKLQRAEWNRRMK